MFKLVPTTVTFVPPDTGPRVGKTLTNVGVWKINNNKAYSKCSNVLNTFFLLFSNKMLVVRAGIHKMLVRTSKQGRPWSDCFFRSSLIWVCTDCLGIFGRQLVSNFLQNLLYLCEMAPVIYRYQQMAWVRLLIRAVSSMPLLFALTEDGSRWRWLITNWNGSTRIH